VSSTPATQPRQVVLAGESPLVDEMAALCAEAGCAVTVHHADDLIDADGLHRLRDDAQWAEVVIEALSESLELKRRILATLDTALTPEALLLSLALSTTATHAGSWIQHPEQLVGFAALPPLTTGGLVELAAGLRSDFVAVDRAREFFASIGLETELVKDSVGLVLPRIVCGLVNEAATALADGVAEAKDIDLAMRLGTNYPRGPLEWGDLIGLDVVLSVLRGLHDETGDDRYRPASIIRQYVRAGWLGKKTGRGFYEYQ